MRHLWPLSNSMLHFRVGRNTLRWIGDTQYRSGVPRRPGLSARPPRPRGLAGRRDAGRGRVPNDRPQRWNGGFRQARGLVGRTLRRQGNGSVMAGPQKAARAMGPEETAHALAPAHARAFGRGTGAGSRPAAHPPALPIEDGRVIARPQRSGARSRGSRADRCERTDTPRWFMSGGTAGTAVTAIYRHGGDRVRSGGPHEAFAAGIAISGAEGARDDRPTTVRGLHHPQRRSSGRP